MSCRLFYSERKQYDIIYISYININPIRFIFGEWHPMYYLLILNMYWTIYFQSLPLTFFATSVARQVMPWLQPAIASLQKDFIFPAPVASSWLVTSSLAPLDSYRPVKDLLACLATCAQVLSQGKCCDVIALHAQTEKLPSLIQDFQASTIGQSCNIFVLFVDNLFITFVIYRYSGFMRR